MPIEEFQWTPLTADGTTDLGKALCEVSRTARGGQDAIAGLAAGLVLMSDGQPTDDWKAGLKRLMDQPWGKKAVRIAIAIGGDADLDCLQEFIGNVEFKPLQANNAERLVQLDQVGLDCRGQVSVGAGQPIDRRRRPSGQRQHAAPGAAAGAISPASSDDVWCGTMPERPSWDCSLCPGN